MSVLGRLLLLQMPRRLCDSAVLRSPAPVLPCSLLGTDFNAPVQKCLDRLTDAKWANSDILLVRPLAVLGWAWGWRALAN